MLLGLVVDDVLVCMFVECIVVCLCLFVVVVVSFGVLLWWGWLID